MKTLYRFTFKIAAACLFLLLAANLFAQVPQYFNYNTAGGGNVFPLNTLPATGKTTQTLYLPGAFTGAIAGDITKFYLLGANAGNATYTSLTIKMGQTTDVDLPPTAWYTGTMTTVYNQTNVNLTSTILGWTMITLQTPFAYNPAQSIIIEITQCGFSGTGINIYTTTLSGIKRHTGPLTGTACPHPWGNTGGFTTHAGIDVLAVPPAGTVTICRNRLAKVLNDHSTIRDTITVNLLPSSRLLDLIVRIDTLTHTWDSDVRAYISRGTIGTRMINNAGGSGDNFFGTNIKDSAALCQIGQAACNVAPFTGTYRPSIGYTFAPFLNTSPNFPWILTLTDTVSGDTGILQAWCLVIRYDQFVGINGNNNQLPTKFSLTQNYPNPFNPSTTVEFSMPKAENVTMSVYDIAGKEVWKLINNGRYEAGTHTVIFDMSKFASGVYFYKIEAGSFTDTKKMMLIK